MSNMHQLEHQEELMEIKPAQNLKEDNHQYAARKKLDQQDQLLPLLLPQHRHHSPLLQNQRVQIFLLVLLEHVLLDLKGIGKERTAIPIKVIMMSTATVVYHQKILSLELPVNKIWKII